MLNSLKKWVQDVAVDLTPPSQSLPTPSFLLSSSKTDSTYHSMRPLQQHLSENSRSNLSRAISVNSVDTIQPQVAIPIELDLSHLNREEQEHIANVLRRARAADEQQTPLTSVVIPTLLPSESTSLTLTNNLKSNEHDINTNNDNSEV